MKKILVADDRATSRELVRVGAEEHSGYLVYGSRLTAGKR